MELQMWIIFFFIVMISSATEEVKKNLTDTEGGSLTLPDPVVEFGFVSFGGKNIAMVDEGKFRIFEEIYKDRLLWNKNTGLITITGLQRNDSGIYIIDSKRGRVFIASYKLTVYESVPTPALNTSVSAESCTLLCFVERAEETTLSWYKDEEIVNQSSSTLSLPLTVHKQDFSSSYRCVAANPAEEKTLPVNVMISCSGQNNTDSRGDTGRHYMIVFPIVSAVIVTLVAFTVKWKYLDKNKRITGQTQDSGNIETEVQYTDIHITEDRRSQGGNLPDSSGPVDRSNLTTVYDKLEAHRMIHTHTADHVYEQTVDPQT